MPVTRMQWTSVLKDADLPGWQRKTDAVITKILGFRTASGGKVGSDLPDLLRQLHESAVAVASAATERAVCDVVPRLLSLERVAQAYRG